MVTECSRSRGFLNTNAAAEAKQRNLHQVNGEENDVLI
jgi:hypothetical protein